MAETERPWNDGQVERVIGTLLRVGVSTAAVLVSLGGLWYLARHGGANPSYHVFAGEAAEYRSVSGVLRGMRTPHGRGLIQLGLLLLIATPVARVAFSVWAFAKEGDRTYVGITLIVLAVLLYSLA